MQRQRSRALGRLARPGWTAGKRQNSLPVALVARPKARWPGEADLPLPAAAMAPKLSRRSNELAKALQRRRTIVRSFCGRQKALLNLPNNGGNVSAGALTTDQLSPRSRGSWGSSSDLPPPRQSRRIWETALAHTLPCPSPSSIRVPPAQAEAELASRQTHQRAQRRHRAEPGAILRAELPLPRRRHSVGASSRT